MIGLQELTTFTFNFKAKIVKIMNPIFDKPYTFDRTVRMIVGLLIACGIVYLVLLLRNALLPFLIAWLLAYMLQPLVNFFQYKLHFHVRILSMLAAFITVGVVIAGICALVIPSVKEESARFYQILQTYSIQGSSIPFIPQQWIDFIEQHLDTNKIMAYMSVENIVNVVKQVLPKAWSLLSGTFSVIVGITVVFIVFLYFFFILLDYEKIANGWIGLIPPKHRAFVAELAGDVEHSMNRYFRGQSLIALCVGILLAIGFKIISFPLAILLGLFIGVLNLVPYLQTIGLIPMALLSWVRAAETGENFWIVFGLSVIVLCIVQVIQDMILTPKIMGHQMGLNPAIILLSLSIWGTLLGFIGLIIALPLTTLCLSYYKRFILNERNNETPEEVIEKTIEGEEDKKKDKK